MRFPLSSVTNSRPERLTSDEFFDLVASSVVMVCPLRPHQNALLYLLASAAGCAACDGRAMGPRIK